MSILSVPFCQFRGNNRFGGQRFPTEEVVIVVFRAVSHQLYRNPNNHFLLVPYQTMELFLQKSSRFFTPFFLTQQTSQSTFLE